MSDWCNINYVLLQANKLKITGYNELDVELIKGLAMFLSYNSSDPNFYVLQSKKVDNVINKYTSGGRRGSNATEGSIFIPVSSFIIGFKTSRTSPLVEDYVRRVIYPKLRLSAAYRELGFVLFMLGFVNRRTYLTYETDVNYVMNKISPKSHADVLYLLPSLYVDAMLLYIENMSAGMDYGFSVYDFVYRAMQVYSMFKLKDINKWTRRLIKRFSNMSISNLDCFRVSDGILEKYPEEVLMVAANQEGILSKDGMVELLQKLIKLGKPVLVTSALKSGKFNSLYNSSTVMYKV